MVLKDQNSKDEEDFSRISMGGRNDKMKQIRPQKINFI